MLWNASSIYGYAIEASDGPLGTVSDLLFEDTNWAARWFVVDTGGWLSGRKVLLPLSALGQPDRALRRFPVKLTMQQVKDSPDVDTDQPVSRQMEARVYSHYKWDPYWGGSNFNMNAMATPFVTPLWSTPPDPRNADDQPAKGDPHLRSVTAITGYHIHATDGEIGHVDDLLIDEIDWSVSYISVDTSNWWLGQKVLISPRSVRKIDWAERLIYLDVDRQKVKDSPAVEPNTTVDQAYVLKHREHYGLARMEN